MLTTVSIVIPAWNEAGRIADTLRSLRTMRDEQPHVRWAQLIVVDDGSTDGTYEEALPWADRIVRNPRKLGKGRSLEIGWKAAAAGSEVILFLDADLGISARHAGLLAQPVLDESADMAIARLPAPARPVGFGLAKGLARRGIYRLTGYVAGAPLSGQRAIRAEALRAIGSLAAGFGVEVGLTIDAARKGYRICEVEVPFTHRETARDWSGCCHRGRQFFAISATLLRKWREGTND